MFQLQDRHSKLDRVWSTPKKIINKPSSDTAKLEAGCTWNAEKLLQERNESNIQDQTPNLISRSCDHSNDNIADHAQSLPDAALNLINQNSMKKTN